MKNILIKTILVFLVFFTYSCEDELNLYPHDSLSPDQSYKTPKDFELAVQGVYSGMFRSGYYGSNGLLSRADIMSDNVTMNQFGRRSQQIFYEWRYSPNLAWNMMYVPYVVTNRANYIINNIDNLQDGAVKNNFLGQAKAARAIALFDMLRLYSKIPTQSSDALTSLGMPIITEVDPNIQKLRPTVAESYAFVIDELEQAKNLVYDSNDSDVFTKNAINGFLSRVYLYYGDYQKSIVAANAVTKTISSPSNFSSIWTDSSEDGVLMKINQDRVLDGIGLGVDWSQSNAGNIKPEYVMSFDLFNLYSNDDVRKSAYTFIGSDSDGRLYNVINKWFGETGQNNGVVDAKLIRVAEVYLNKAESYFMIGDEANALSALDVVRNNRYSSFAGGETGQNLLDAIKLERRLELFAEGHRFFDLKRWGDDVVRSTTFGEFFDGTGTPPSAEFSTLTNGFKFQLPIPIDEINVFPDFQQNPGY